MYKPETNRWIKIQTTTRGKAFFYHHGKRISMSLIIKCHRNPWIGGEGIFPEFIHGYKVDEYYNPLFVEINSTGTAVKVYRFEGR